MPNISLNGAQETEDTLTLRCRVRLRSLTSVPIPRDAQNCHQSCPEMFCLFVWPSPLFRILQGDNRWFVDNSKLRSTSPVLPYHLRAAFVIEKAWPMCSRPFMYGYGKVTRNLPPSCSVDGSGSA